jgi:hypothetical protein
LSLSNLIRKQPQNGFETNALLSDKRHGVDFSTIVVIGSCKSQGDDLSCPRMLAVKGSMLLGRRFTLPLTAGAGLASDRIKVRTTTVQFSIVHEYDVHIADVHAIQHFSANLIKPIFYHD